MSSDSLALLRRNVGPELAQLAEEHLKHDLQESDRGALRSAAQKLSTYTTVGSLVGLGLGVALAFRIRRVRKDVFAAVRGQQRPTHVRFADGREEAIPDLTPMMRPSALGDVAAYLFFSAGGLFVGGELSLLGGSLAAKRTIAADPDSSKRIETAFRRFRADVLRKEIDRLEGPAPMAGSQVGLW